MNYSEYVMRRIVWMAVSLFGLSVIIFTTSRVLPGNPARLALGPRATDQQVAELAEQMGLNDPIPVQYVEYLQGLVVGDLGQSLRTRNPVLQDIIQYLPATLELVTVAMVFTLVFGVGLGVVAATNQDGLFDTISRGIAFSGVSLPGFFIGIALQLIFGYLLGWLPITGRLASEYSGSVSRQTGFMLVDTLLAGQFAAHVNAWLHLLLPALALSLAGMGQVVRITRSSMLDVISEEFVEAEKSLGLPPWLVNFKYVLSNALIAPLTILGLVYANLLGNAFLIELVFSWPGMATYGLNAILNNDINALVGVTMTVGLAFVVINFLVDLLVTRIDPRARLDMEGAAG
jgi:peptide/nickel transport system permease protein